MKEKTVSCEPLFDYIDQHLGDFIEELVRICEIAAPPFQEQNRAQYFASLFEKLGFTPILDEVGNVIIPVVRDGSPRVVLSAHLDTVFPFETIHVDREGSILRAPGISDDSSGLAALVLICKAFRETSFPLHGSLTLLATVGEEGLGNLRGVRHFFSQNRNHVDYFISIDGSDADRLVISGIASKRIRVLLRGPGGHSWGDAGTPNPIHAAGELLSHLNRMSLPRKPKTSINVGVIGGGTSINAIPTEMFLDIDMRSESAEALAALDESVQNTLQEITRIQPAINSEIRIVGERPAGAISLDHKLVQAAKAANKQMALDAKTDTGSTDSNIPFALGIPAITLGAGGKSGKIHTPEEWYDVSGVSSGLKRTALLLVDLLDSKQ
jgi:tripeptide aminopeptidase